MNGAQSALNTFLPLYSVLVARGDAGRWRVFVDALQDTGRVILTEVDSAAAARQFLEDNRVAAVLIDADLADGRRGADFLREVSMGHPFVNTALVSGLSAEDFHESTEGFGVFMQLPTVPDGRTVTEFLEKLDIISRLSAS